MIQRLEGSIFLLEMTRVLLLSLRRLRHDLHLLVQHDARERIELADPGLALKHRFGVGDNRHPSAA